MKITKFAILIVMSVLVSCSKELTQNNGVQNADVSVLPDKSTQYIDNNYPDAVITGVNLYSNGITRYVVDLNTDEVLAFDQTGGFLCDSTAFPPDSIPGGMHGHHGPHHHGHGHFNPGPCHGFGHGHGNGIPVDSLAQAIVDYVTANYAGYTIQHAAHDSICQFGLVTVVVAADSTGHVKLYFDSNNNYLMKDQRILYSAVPQAIASYITTNYPGFMPCFKAIKMTLANGNIEYMVFLKHHHMHKRVIFMDDGTFVCEH